MMKMPKVLITGASGYLGQHLVSSLLPVDEYEVYALYNSMKGFAEAVKEKSPQCHVASLDLTDSTAVQSYLDENGPFDVCLHLAALSSPRACQENSDKARALNVPTHFFDALQASATRIVALSTDQVYGGDKKSPYLEDSDATKPLNVYAETKVELENYLLAKQQQRNDVVLLRSSILLGPKAPLCGEAHDTFLHFCASRETNPTTFFTDECRSVMAVSDVVQILKYFLKNTTTGAVYNMGGPSRVSRHDMALAVAHELGWTDAETIVLAAKKTDQPVGAVVSPLDITMDSRKLQTLVGFEFQPLSDVVKATFAT